MSVRPRRTHLLAFLLFASCAFDSGQPSAQVPPTHVLAPLAETVIDEESCAISDLRVTYRDDDSPARGEITVRWESATSTSAALAVDVEGAAPEADVVPAGQTRFVLGTRIQDSDETDGDVKVTVHIALPCGAALEQEFVFEDPLKSCAVAQLGAIDGYEADFYQCADRWLAQGEGCGPNGYLQGYGTRYADKFYNVTRPRLSKRGKEWIDETLVCLQERLRSAIAIGMSCDEVNDIAFGTHPNCYAESGFCTLPFPDVLHVLVTIDERDLLSEDGIRQLIAVVPECGEEYAEILTGKSLDLQVAASEASQL
jgi:hypothetical protein